MCILVFFADVLFQIEKRTHFYLFQLGYYMFFLIITNSSVYCINLGI